VAASGAALITSVPLHPAQWSGFDAFVGHRRRYEPTELMTSSRDTASRWSRSAVFGMQPKSSPLIDLGMWFDPPARTRDVWYNRVMMPLACVFRNRWRCTGLIDTTTSGSPAAVPAQKRLERDVVFHVVELARRFLAPYPRRQRRAPSPSRAPASPAPCRLPSICMRSATISVVVRSFPSLSCHLRVRKDPSM